MPILETWSEIKVTVTQNRAHTAFIIEAKLRTLIRLLIWEQSDLGPQCLQINKQMGVADCVTVELLAC